MHMCFVACINRIAYIFKINTFFFLKPIHREWTLRFDTSNIYLPIPNIQQLTEETWRKRIVSHGIRFAGQCRAVLVIRKVFFFYFFYFFFLQMNRRSNWNEMTGDEENEEKKNWKYFTYVSSLNLIKYSVFILEVWRGSLILYFFYDSCSGQRIIKILGVFPFIHKWIEKKNLNIECDIIIVVHLIFSFC